ncbi:MAG: hypothetical protein IH845_03970 [Nanoarchaeota archaeon]|nr:hypothetical protein [Nanoarchaeota archaeon]
MNNFLDTCVIIANFDEIESHHKRAKEFIGGNERFLISEFQKSNEIPGLFLRKRRSVMKILKFIMTQTLDLEGYGNKKIELKELLKKYSLENPTKENLNELIGILNGLERKVDDFINLKIEKIIPNCTNKKLIKSLEIVNMPDAKIIASALIEHQTNPLILNTLDKKDWEKKKIKRACYRNDFNIPQVNYL